MLKAIREFALWGGVVGCFLFAGLEFGDLWGGGGGVLNIPGFLGFWLCWFCKGCG